jgi:hypothetical protein
MLRGGLQTGTIVSQVIGIGAVGNPGVPFVDCQLAEVAVQLGLAEVAPLR